jgi:hypothetical protein
MKKVVSIAAAGLLALAVSGPAWAECAGHAKTADVSTPSTTADATVMTPRPKGS